MRLHDSAGSVSFGAGPVILRGAGMTKFCRHCNEPIPEIRLEFLPHTTECVGCSTESKAVGFQIYAHKTAGEVFIVPGDDSHGIDLARAVYQRRR